MHKVVAKSLLHYYVIVLVLGSYRGWAAEQTHEQYLSWLHIKKFGKMQVCVLSHKLVAYFSMVARSSFDWKSVLLKMQATCKMQPCDGMLSVYYLLQTILLIVEWPVNKAAARICWTGTRTNTFYIL